MRVDWCVSSWFRIKNTHSLTREERERRERERREERVRECAHVRSGEGVCGGL